MASYSFLGFAPELIGMDCEQCGRPDLGKVVTLSGPEGEIINVGTGCAAKMLQGTDPEGKRWTKARVLKEAQKAHLEQVRCGIAFAIGMGAAGCWVVINGKPVFHPIDSKGALETIKVLGPSLAFDPVALQGL